LLKHSADPNAAGTNGMTPLLLAASAGYGGKLCVAALLDAGAEVDKTGSGGITPLMLAASHRQVESVRILLTHGADARRSDGYGHDALFYARQSLVSLSEDADVSGIEEDAETKAWHLQYTQEQEANGQRCIALLEAALR